MSGATLSVVRREELGTVLPCDICLRRRAGTLQLRVVPDRVFIAVCERQECREKVVANLRRLAPTFEPLLKTTSGRDAA